MELTDNQINMLIDFVIDMYNNGLIQRDGKFASKSARFQYDFNTIHRIGGSKTYTNFLWHPNLGVQAWEDARKFPGNNLNYIKNFIKEGEIWLAGIIGDKIEWHYLNNFPSNIINDNFIINVIKLNKEIYNLQTKSELEKAADLLADDEFDDI